VVKFNENRKVLKFCWIFVFSELNDCSRSDSNFTARDVKFSKILAPTLLNIKKTKEKKHKANKISSSKTTISKKHKTENEKNDTIKNMSNI
jgi:hypothetical protein